MKILSIESSCDESAVAVFDTAKGIELSLIHSQIDLHALYGGVVPDLASSQHLKMLPALIGRAKQECDINGVDEIVATSGPGLPNCLEMGVSAASALAMMLKKPLFGVNHLDGHAYSPFIEVHAQNPENFRSEFEGLLPHLGLTVSGGNTVLFEICTDGKLHVIAETIDDAAGEALDKGAKLLGIAYPGAPVLERLARAGRVDKNLFPCGKNRKIEDDPNFSFSGLKTSLRYYIEKLDAGRLKESLPDICASYQFAVIEQLRLRAEYFARRGKYASLGISGGVSNNSRFAEAFEGMARRSGAKFLIAPKQYRGDNAAMIAFAAFMRPDHLQEAKNATLCVNPAWTIQ